MRIRACTIHPFCLIYTCVCLFVLLSRFVFISRHSITEKLRQSVYLSVCLCVFFKLGGLDFRKTALRYLRTIDLQLGQAYPRLKIAIDFSLFVFIIYIIVWKLRFLFVTLRNWLTFFFYFNNFVGSD